MGLITSFFCDIISVKDNTFLKGHAMAFDFSALVSNFLTPNAVTPLSSNGTNNYIYLDADGQSFELDIHQEVVKFIAREFTKGKFVLKNVSNNQRLDYLLNLKPSDNQTANQMMYEFAFGLLKFGRVYYKVYFAPNAKAPTSIEIYSTQPDKQGFKVYEYPQLKLQRPSTLLDKYANLIDILSTKQSSNVLEIQSSIKANDVRKENENVNGYENQSVDFQNKSNPRLTAVNNQIKRFGSFLTNTNESTKDHANLTNPDGTALADLRALIYEQLHISSKLLDGSYTEEEYRAFYASQLRPLMGAFEELLNAELFDYNSYIAGSRIKLILDLVQFATLESFTTFAKETLYTGTTVNDDLRENLGLEAYPDGLGQIIFSNKNAVALNNPEVNALLQTGSTANENTSNVNNTSTDGNE
ncbi:portal protein [Leuconostoc phage phiLN6B]|jgi:hypothetical protein|uniref:Portal protein n=5 Tax=Limdunavirus TaxID=2169621 RepID=M4I780_9CAUD|nr:portal protein [Leuconostoc phage LN04]YP_009044307.1 portal protein [Leuconostoc phage phiLN6B]YP_009044730.1 portal protein [Leuconostoc phage phiLN12]YP_009044964.1 portal protein [Leuconostoc phage LN03]AFY98221.1 portal protein [Leuconostoc phage LN03]AFY98262.1 portal protein [Leuconostoc phage LN04]AFY98300.1 portal protein [Leuconostoc phage phiLN6B]AFY98339.1 portal protein [Leuconostoc phage phiLN12]